MTQAKPAGAKALYKPKLWHSALFGLLAGSFYLLVLEGSSIGSPVVGEGVQYYGAGTMVVIGFVAWHKRTLAAVLWACSALTTFALEGAGVFDWLAAVVVSIVALGPFINFEGLAFVEKIFKIDNDESPARTPD